MSGKKLPLSSVGGVCGDDQRMLLRCMHVRFVHDSIHSGQGTVAQIIIGTQVSLRTGRVGLGVVGT